MPGFMLWEPRAYSTLDVGEQAAARYVSTQAEMLRAISQAAAIGAPLNLRLQEDVVLSRTTSFPDAIPRVTIDGGGSFRFLITASLDAAFALADASIVLVRDVAIEGVSASVGAVSAFSCATAHEALTLRNVSTAHITNLLDPAKTWTLPAATSREGAVQTSMLSLASSSTLVDSSNPTLDIGERSLVRMSVGASASGTLTLSSGTQGQVLILFCSGVTAPGTVTLADATSSNVRLAGAWTPTARSSLVLFWDASDGNWQELSRVAT